MTSSPKCTGLTLDDTKIDFALTIIPNHQRSHVHQWVNLKVDLATRCSFKLAECQWLLLTCEKVVDTAALWLCTQGATNDKKIYKHPPQRQECLLHPHVKKGPCLEKKNSHIHTSILIDEVWSWISNNFIFERFSYIVCTLKENCRMDW